MTACGGGSEGSLSAPTAGALAVAPTSITLSLTASNGAPKSISSLTWAQPGAAGTAVVTSTCSPPNGNVLFAPTSFSQTVSSSGVLNGSEGPITAEALGTCEITITPATGAPFSVTVGVGA
ncbi:MAG: hypothetical protein IAI50_13630 [Candidatus Eremiobacteraeota bacterium]|nr:hypothetical protein [Candidatus Eremiobacteraeota bacterium]